MKGKSFLVLPIIMLSLIAVCCIGQEPSELEGTLWKLDSYVNYQGVLVSVLPDTEITAQFTGGEVKGSSGCNTYGGVYEIDGTAVTIGSLFMTEMACLEPEGVMEQEGDYLTALGSVVSFKISGSRMEMTNADGMLILVFVSA